MLFLTAKQHQEVLRRLLGIARDRVGEIPIHSAGFGYSSLMNCFLLHNLSAAETLLRILASFGDAWFPVTVGYAIARTMFEADVTAHYISQMPAERTLQYIEFGAVLKKREMEACLEHCQSENPRWREAMQFVWQHHWAPRQAEVQGKFDAVAPQFSRVSKGGREVVFQNWSGKTLRQVAAEVDHLEAYDTFYAELSSFTHVDVRLADRFLHNRPDGPVWSQRAEEGDVGNVFRYGAIFLTCYLELFGRQFNTWSQERVQKCWQMEAEQTQPRV
jgi:hypothetical protein